MHWGHAVSEDLLHWEYLPLALAPSEEYDDYRKGGCFSGSAIVHEGKLFLMYTGVTNRGSGNIQTQCIAYSEDGIHFEKYEGNPVILPPEGVDGQHFRDPKIWKHKDSYYMVCGASCNNRRRLFCTGRKTCCTGPMSMCLQRAGRMGLHVGMSGFLSAGG